MSKLDLKINTDSAASIYQQIADGIKNKIRTKELRPGNRIPSEKELSDGLKVSRGTVRKAIEELVDDNTLEKVQGKGTFVKENKISVPFAQELISYAETMKSKGIAFKTRVLVSQEVTVPESLRKKLRLKTNDKVLYLKRIRSVDDQPAFLLNNWVVLKRCPGIQKVDYNQTPLFEAIEKITNTKIKYGVRSFLAKSLDKEQAYLMNLKKGSAVLNINQLTFDEDDQPIEYSDAFLRTDKYQVTSILYR